MKKDTKLLPRKLWEFGARFYLFTFISSTNKQTIYCACPHFVFRSVTLVMSEEDWRERPQLGGGHWAKWLLQMELRTGGRRGRGVEWGLSGSLSHCDRTACCATAGRLREELFIWPCMIAVLCCLKWTSKMSEADKEPRSGKIAGGSSVFSIGHYADCKFSLQSDLLTKSVLLCCSLSAQRYVNIIEKKSPCYSVK